MIFGRNLNMIDFLYIVYTLQFGEENLEKGQFRGFRGILLRALDIHQFALSEVTVATRATLMRIGLKTSIACCVRGIERVPSIGGLDIPSSQPFASGVRNFQTAIWHRR